MVKEKHIKVIIVTMLTVTVIAFSFIIISFFSNNNDYMEEGNVLLNTNRIPEDWYHLDIEVKPLPVDELDGFMGIGGWIGTPFLDEDAGEEPGILEMTTPQDRINIDFVNSSENLKKTFLLKPFLNYEKANFRVAGMEEYVTEFIFTVPPGSQATVPIYLEHKIEIEDANHGLTVVGALFPERWTYLEGDNVLPFSLNWDWGMVLHFELDYGLASITLEIEPERDVMHLDAFGGFSVNQDFLAYREDSPTRDGHFYNPPALLQVAPTSSANG